MRLIYTYSKLEIILRENFNRGDRKAAFALAIPFIECTEIVLVKEVHQGTAAP